MSVKENLPAEEEIQEPEGVEKKLENVFKAISDLQAAVKDLAGIISASTEAQRGLLESLDQIKGEFVSMKDLLKTVTVSSVAGSAPENKPADTRFQGAKTPEHTEGAEPVTVSETKEPAEHLYEGKAAEAKGKIVVVETPRPEVDVKKAMPEDASVSLIKDILSGKGKAGEYWKRIKEVVSR